MQCCLCYICMHPSCKCAVDTWGTVGAACIFFHTVLTGRTVRGRSHCTAAVCASRTCRTITGPWLTEVTCSAWPTSHLSLNAISTSSTRLAGAGGTRHSCSTNWARGRTSTAAVIAYSTIAAHSISLLTVGSWATITGSGWLTGFTRLANCTASWSCCTVVSYQCPIKIQKKGVMNDLWKQW